MAKVSKLKGLWVFALVFVGTAGLLANELVFDWGRAATLLFAGVNAVGLVALSPILWGASEGQEE